MNKKRITINTNLYDFAVYYIDLYSDVIYYLVYWALCIGITFGLYYSCKDEELYVQIEEDQIEYFQMYKDYFIMCLYTNCIYFFVCVGLLGFVKPKISNGLNKDLTGIQVIYALVSMSGLQIKTYLFAKYILNTLQFRSIKTNDMLTTKAKFIDVFVFVSNIHNFFGSGIFLYLLLVGILISLGTGLMYIWKAILYMCANIKITYTREVELDEKLVL